MTTTQNTAAQAEYVIIEKFDAKIFNIDNRLPAEGTPDGDDDGVGCALTSFILFADDSGKEHRVQLKDICDDGNVFVIPDPTGDPGDEVEVYFIDEVGPKAYFIVIDDWNPYTDDEMNMLFGHSEGIRTLMEDDDNGEDTTDDGERTLFSNPLDDGWVLLSDPTSETGWAAGWEWLKDIPSQEVSSLVDAINHAIAVYESSSVDDKEE